MPVLTLLLFFPALMHSVIVGGGHVSSAAALPEAEGSGGGSDKGKVEEFHCSW